MNFLSILNDAASYLLQPTTLAFALAATGLAVHFGFTGLLNFGMAAFMALGAYGYAISIVSFGLPWWTAMLVGMLAATVFAVVLGIPTLRLRADYLAIVTIAAAEIVRYLFLTESFTEYTAGSGGLSGYARAFIDASPLAALPSDMKIGFGPFSYTPSQLSTILFGLLMLAIAILLVWALMRSPWGRVIKGIREDEDAVRSLGKNVFAYKMQSLIIGGVIAAVGGIVWVMGSATSPGLYTTSTTFQIWTMLLLGGAATIFGPALGAVIYLVAQSFLSGLLSGMAKAGMLPFTDSQAKVLVLILLGLVLMLIVIFRPQGILGNKRELTFVK
ncbi:MULTISPECIES: branched-chain amino acid ABC transporter permease [Microbacterium]|jgi:neutral amino acid transport system permease protein|uniref:branched-chain amino acid ABC transporter permease n=1 Tax=Microbacterium TaxID=33882 RepID=UPI001E652BB1|nr:branched-chain amino acid ABC transporter permease [Microbacterium nymphoidis]MCD2497757.1 branched-chain amino acid ABC transporter permease [Microbacterium nymphoidis]